MKELVIYSARSGIDLIPVKAVGTNPSGQVSVEKQKSMPFVLVLSILGHFP